MPFTPEDITAARAACRGRILLPGEPGFDDANNRLFNRMFADRIPAVIFQPQGAADVAQAIQFARTHQLPVVARCGGHHAAGRSTAHGGVLVDMCRINNVFVDPKAQLAHVGGGCLLGDVDRELAPYGLAVPLGAFPFTGVGGLALHGGLGLLSGLHGLAADNIVEVEVVTSDGRIQVANDEVNADLFFVMRGLASYYGIVTRITFKAFPIADNIVGGMIAQPYQGLEPHLQVLRRHTLKKAEMGTYMFVANSPHGPTILTLASHLGADQAAAKADLNDFATLAPVVQGAFVAAPYWKVNGAFGDFMMANPPPPSRQYWRPFVVDIARLEDPAFLAAVQQAIALTLASEHVPATMIVVEPWNRGVRTNPRATPLCNIRGEFLVFAFIFGWLETQPDEPAMAVVNAVTDLLRGFMQDRNYVNYVGSLDVPAGKVGRPINEDIRPKLRNLKAKWDSAAVFHAV